MDDGRCLDAPVGRDRGDGVTSTDWRASPPGSDRRRRRGRLAGDRRRRSGVGQGQRGDRRLGDRPLDADLRGHRADRPRPRDPADLRGRVRSDRGLLGAAQRQPRRPAPDRRDAGVGDAAAAGRPRRRRGVPGRPVQHRRRGPVGDGWAGGRGDRCRGLAAGAAPSRRRPRRGSAGRERCGGSFPDCSRPGAASTR